jgi:hypothetical protein
MGRVSKIRTYKMWGIGANQARLVRAAADLMDFERQNADTLAEYWKLQRALALASRSFVQRSLHEAFKRFVEAYNGGAEALKEAKSLIDKGEGL